MAEKMTDKIVRLMSNPKNIRNIGTSAHIHHGKTAFADNLIAAAGMMSQQLAGEALMLNYRQDEIDRCMTIDSAVISMVHKKGDDEFLINLIDTPGHVDFSGDVTRAMRALDGTILLVCASEGVMPQTETVLKQALKERVKPVLFINKVDRLITELKLSPEKIQERFVKIIAHVNRLIKQIAEPQYGDEWQVSVQDGSVAFGSARQNWALSLPFMQKTGVKFKDIVDAYELEPEKRQKVFDKKAPLFEVILDMSIEHMPSPVDAQPYRIPKIWKGETDTELGQSLINTDPAGPPLFVVIKIIVEPQVGEVVYGRIYSGTLKKGQEIYLNKDKQRQRIQQVFVSYGQKREWLENIPAGNIVGLIGVKTMVGETISLEPSIQFEELTHIFDPVISKSIEAKNPADLPKLIEVLRKVGKEDPTIKVEINQETGENLISGMGELHLEIVENRIKTEKGVEVKTSSPIVVYRETITGESGEVEGKSPNKHNKFYMKVRPVKPEVQKLIKRGIIPSGRIKKKDETMAIELRKLGWDTKTIYKIKANEGGNLFLELTRGEVHMQEVIELILDMFGDVMKAGPLAKEPVINTEVSLTDVKLHEDAIHRGPAQVYPAIREAVRGAMMQAKPVLYEPLQILRLEAPEKYIGELTKLVSSKRGQMLNLTHEGYSTVMEAKLPVAEMIGWSSELRSATEGHGNFSVIDQMFERVPMELQDKVRQQIIQRKGLSAGKLGA